MDIYNLAICPKCKQEIKYEHIDEDMARDGVIDFQSYLPTSSFMIAFECPCGHKGQIYYGITHII